MEREIRFTLNGEERRITVRSHHTFMDVLHNQLRITGPREVCGLGVCGACTVLLDDRPVATCVLLAPFADGADIKTIEGLAPPGGLHVLQQAFLEEAALQCGICTPGLLIAAKGLLDQEPHPDEQMIRQWLAGNLCRCTGYDKVVRAVQKAAEMQAR